MRVCGHARTGRLLSAIGLLQSGQEGGSCDPDGRGSARPSSRDLLTRCEMAPSQRRSATGRAPPAPKKRTFEPKRPFWPRLGPIFGPRVRFAYV